MKYYEYKETLQKQISDVFDKHDAFFAFSKEQLEKGKKEGVKYYFLDGGMFLPQDNYEQFNIDYKAIDENFTKTAKELFTSLEIIRYELANHEYCITYDLTDTKEVLEDYLFSDEEYKIAIKEYLAECDC
jgi:nucleoid-associated protein YejK